MKKLTTQLQNLIDTFGYWSNEVFEFNNSLDFDTMNKINSKVKR